ncbi:MAG TPA: L-rhamnose/proton symporter RhaT [Paludibacteraceae bacterium]|nr:L-rhamnose/proton symporter RhaT [Paludibacteraceae bacterium]HPT43462.1 L-rhamnose/proton symporter RhaT [Paludibacteraceae bacterium]
MNTIIGLLIIAVGSMGQSSSYVPIKKVKTWAWESFWLVQGIFAWLIFPYLGALLAVPDGHSLLEILSSGYGAAWKAMFFGALWGVGGLTFGLSMRYLGVALGQSIALGTCSAFGTLIPALMTGTDLLHGKGLVLLIGVSVAIAGIAVIGYAGSLRAKNMTEEQKKAAIKDFALGKGLLVAILAGVMSACFSLGLEAAEPLKAAALSMGTKALYAGLPAILMITLGGFVTNAFYCIYQNFKNKTQKDYFKVPGNVLLNNLLFCALAGILWYSQFFGLALGKSFLTEGSTMMAFSWSILMSLNVTFSNVWGIILKEWKGAGKKAVGYLVIGMLILIFSLIIPSLF